MGVTPRQQRLIETVNLVAEHHDDGKTRLPVEEVYGCGAGFDGGDLALEIAESLNVRHRVRASTPPHVVLRAQRGLRNLPVRRMPGDARQADLLESNGVGRPKERADVVQAPDVVQDHLDGQGAEVLVPFGQLSREPEGRPGEVEAISSRALPQVKSTVADQYI